MKFKNYFNELKLVIKEHYILIVSFIVVSIILQFISVPFLSILLMLILMFYISKTEEYKSGSLIGKIVQFILFFVFMIFLFVIILMPISVFSLGLENLTPEKVYNSYIIQNETRILVCLFMFFIFAPFRIFDADVNVFKAIVYSFSVIVNNFLLFIIISVFVIGLNLMTLQISFLDYFIDLFAVILAVSLYRLNVKQILLRGDKNENN
jgi:hypothetical protein